MDEPKRRRFRFGLRTLLVAVGVVGGFLGLFARPTDPTLVREGMTKPEVWWQCGWPDDTETDGWYYVVNNPDRRLSSVFIAFDKHGYARLIYFNR